MPYQRRQRYLITGDSEEANKKANRPQRDLDPLALDQDRRTVVEAQATWDYYNEEIKSIMYDSLVASSIAESYYDVDLTARANWKKFEKHFLPKGATHRRLLEIDPRYVLPNWLLNVKLIRLCRQRGMNTFADYCVNSISNLLNPTDGCLPFDVLRKKFVDSETQQQLAPQEAGGAAPYSNAAFMVGIPNRQRRGSYKSLRGRGQSTVARGGVAGNHASSRTIAGTLRDGAWFECTRCKRGHSWPCYFDPQLPNHQNLIGGINVTVTRPM